MSKKTMTQELAKAKLIKEAEAEIARLLEDAAEWQAEHPEATWDEIELEVLHLRQRFGAHLGKVMAKCRAEQRPVPGPRCPECGEELRYKGEKERLVVSMLGEIPLKRGYYYCSACRRSSFPLDQALDLHGQRWSPYLMRTVTWLAGHLPYGRVQEVLAELSGVEVSSTSAWRIGQQYGEALQTVLAAEETEIKAQSREWSTPGKRTTPRERMGVAMDGAMMNIRDEGWKEFKVGTVFEIEPRQQCDPQTGACEMYGHAINISYVAHLGGPEDFGWKVWTEAHRRGWQRAWDSQVLGDGAVWIWNLHQEHFHTSLGVVDWYHATGHLSCAQHTLYPEGGSAATCWYNRQKEALYQGHADQIAREISQRAAQEDNPDREAEIKKEAGYFKNNHERMQYRDYRLEGWPIGSGMVESGAKQFKTRVTGPGMRWGREGAQNILAVRGAVLTGRERFDSLWARAYTNSPPS